MRRVMLVFLWAAAANAQLIERCNWGVGQLAPQIWTGRNQVMMMPVTMDFTSPASGNSQIAFVSFEGGAEVSGDKGGVLRVIDAKCREIAQFPPPAPTGPIPPSCPSNIYSHFLSPLSTLAAGNVDSTPDVEIIAVLDEATTPNHQQIVALNLKANPLRLVPKWCSQHLPLGDSIAPVSAIAIAQLDRPHPANNPVEIIIDNKVYNSNGTLRYNGNCPACSRSRTPLVTKFLGPASRPQIITGRGAYRSNPISAPAWAGTPWWTATAVNNGSLGYSAVANLDSIGQPEIVVVDTINGKLDILNTAGVLLASDSLGGQCGGPPMIGDADGVPGPEIGVATCSEYRLYKYAGSLSQVWPSKQIGDPSGQTASVMINTPTGARIFYADASTLWVFNGATGAVLQQIPNSSATGIEGPAIAASFPNGGPASVIVAANNYLNSAGQTGVRIFDDPTLGPARSFWNQYNYHGTNVLTPNGAIPVTEQPNWQAHNTYRVQQWP